MYLVLRAQHRKVQAQSLSLVLLLCLLRLWFLHTGTVVKAGEIWAGVPAKLLRHLSADEKGFVSASADNYARIATEHR